MYDPSNEPEPKVVSFLDAVEPPALIAVATVATIVVAFWLLPGLDGIAPSGWDEMSVHTALGFILASLSLALSRPRTSALSRRLSTFAAAGVVVIGVTSVIADLLGTTAIGSAAFPLPSPQTGITFFLLGTGILLVGSRQIRLAADVTALILWAVLLFMLGGHIFQAAELYVASDGRLMSLQTLLSAQVIAFVLSGRLARSDSILSVLANSGLGSRILRRVGLVIVIAPFFIFALVAFLYETSIFPAAFTRAVFAPLVVIGVFLIIGWMGVRINQLERSLRRHSATDEMTGILNQRGFSAVGEYLVRASQRAETPLTVFYFDLDGLKKVNDTLGHTTGSLLIKQFANLLTDTFRKHDVVARVGGDEFAVLATSDDTVADQLMQRLAHNTELANREPHVPFKVSYSVGFAQLDFEKEHCLDRAMTVADGFMYELKNAKRRRGKPAETTAPFDPASSRVPDWSI